MCLHGLGVTVQFADSTAAATRDGVERTGRQDGEHSDHPADKRDA
jgi:hypothetical protein